MASVAASPKLHTPAQITKRMQASPISYDFATVEQLKDINPKGFADHLYPRAVEQPVVAKSAVTVEGEQAYARREYRAALASFDRALASDPADGEVHLLRSNALRQLGQQKEADQALLWALTLRPRNSLALGLLKKQGKLNDVPFEPRAFVRQEGQAWRIYTDQERPYWIGWGACKALWMSDADYRKNKRHDFSTNEELECLNALVTTYAAKHAAPDPLLDRLLDIVKKKQGWAWVMYELASRVDPHAVARLPEARRKAVFSFVARYVAGDN